MRIEGQQGDTGIYFLAKKNENSNSNSNSNVNNDGFVREKEICKSKNNSRFDISENIVSHPIIYNNATIENTNSKLPDKQEDEMTDEEITYEMNKEIYDSEKLSEKGIKFNSKEFFELLEKQKKGNPVPYDAPPKIRKKLKDTLDKLRNENGPVWFFTLKALVKGLKGKNTKDPNLYLDICNNTIEKSENEISSLVIAGLDTNPLFKGNMEINKGLIDFFSKIKKDISSYYPEQRK